MQLLTDNFISSYNDAPDHMTELGSFVFYRTYSRWVESAKRRETWKEMVRRSVEYQVGLAAEQYKRNNFYFIPWHDMRQEAEELFDNIFNIRQFLSGRTHWVGGGEGGVSKKFPLANFNCSFINVKSWNDLVDLFYLLLVGTGVGFKATKDMARNLAPIRTDVKVEHMEYEPLPKSQRAEHTQVVIMDSGYAKIIVGDSKEGWCAALKEFLNIHTNPELEHIHTLKIDYNSVRKKGERLKTFGGTASGHEPLMEMFIGFDKVIHNELDPHLAPLERVNSSELYSSAWTDKGYVRVRPIHILDMGNLIGNNVVVGGVRRTAEIFLCDADDWECILAKYGINGIWAKKEEDGGEEAFERHEKIKNQLIGMGVQVPTWFDEVGTRNYDPEINDGYAFNFGRPLHHRRMSNNSIAFTSKPSRELLNFVFTVMQGEGEPGFVNLEQLARRRFKGMGILKPTQDMLDLMMVEIGMNPCAEIDLFGYGVCNLTTVNVKAFVYYNHEKQKNDLDLEGLYKAQRLSARAGLRMTTVTLELPHWDAVQKRDTLCGTSLTGWKDALALIDADEIYEQWLLNNLRKIAREEADSYAKELRVPAPTLVTTVKPEGTLSQVAGGVSSGLHQSHSPFYIRRIRINATDPLVQLAKSLGWTIHAEVGTVGETEFMRLLNARTLVIDFPVASGSKITKDDVSAIQQLETYKRFQRHYSEHNSSNTITVRNDEWLKVEEWVFNNWEQFTAVSFLSHDGGSYELAPYESITEEQYHEMKSNMKPFDPKILELFELGSLDDLDVGNDGCEAGVCPPR